MATDSAPVSLVSDRQANNATQDFADIGRVEIDARRLWGDLDGASPRLRIKAAGGRAVHYVEGATVWKRILAAVMELSGTRSRQ